MTENNCENKVCELMNEATKNINEISAGNPVTDSAYMGEDGVIAIPVCEVSIGIAGGGSDTAKQKSPAGIGAKVTRSPKAILLIKDDTVKVTSLSQSSGEISIKKAIDFGKKLFKK